MQVFANVIFAAALILPSGEPDDWSREFRGLISDYPEDLEAVYAMPDRVKARVDRALLQLSHGAGPRAVADVITGENFIARAVVGKRLIEAGSAPDSVIARLFRDKKRVVRYATMRAYQATADFNAELLEPLISDSDQAISELAALAILERQKERVVELLPKLVRRTRAFQHIYDSIEPMERLKVRAKVRELRKSINPEVREAAIARCGTEGWYEPSEIRKFMSSLSPQDRHFGCGLVRTAEQANALEDVLASCLREETSVGHAAISAASWSSRYLPKLRKLMDWEDLLSQLCAAESIAIVDPSDKASVERLATLALSKEPDVAVSALYRMHQIRDDRVVSCLDKLRPLIVEPKFASGDAPLNSGDVITEFTILLRKCKMKASPIVARWLSEPEPVPGFHISLLVNFSSPGFLGSYLELDGQLIDGITRHFDSAKPAKRDAAIAALSTLLRGDDIVDISASSEHFTHALRTKDQSLLVSALNSLKLLSVKNPELLESQLRELVRSTELDVRAAAAAVFASLYPKMQKEVLPIAEEAIDTDLPEAVPLIQALGEDGVPLLPAIMQAIKRGHPNRDDWIMAEQSWANAFSEMRESDAVGPLLEGLQDKDPDVRWACASALRHFVNNQNVIDALAARVDDTAGGKFPVSRRAMESLMLADRPRDQLVPRLISVLNGISPQEQSATHRAAVRLLARIGPPAEKAFPPLAKYGYVQRVRYGVEWCSHVSIQSYETAVAARAVTPTSRIGLAGFREIIKSVASGRTWLPLSQHVETDTLDNTRNSGFAMTIDYIVEHEVKELADTLEQSSKPPLLHPDYRADLLFALAAVDPQGGWQIKLEALASSGSSRAKYRLGSDPDDVPF